MTPSPEQDGPRIDPGALLPAPAHHAPPRAAVDDVVALFLAGRRPGTLRGYRGALRAFTAFAGAQDVGAALRGFLGGTAGDANRLAISWRAHLIEKGHAPATVNCRITALRAVVKLARTVGMVEWTLEVPGVRAETYRDTRGPGRVGVRALLSHVEGATTPKELRDRALVRLLADLALRRAEAVGIDVDDVDLDGGTVAVRGKGRSGKVKLTLPPPTAAALRDWLAVRGDAAGPVFTSMTRGRPATRLSGTSVARIVRDLGRAVGIEQLRPHGLRHAAITEALDLTRGDIRAVQRFSRHADPRTVVLYDDARTDTGGEIAKLVAAWR